MPYNMQGPRGLRVRCRPRLVIIIIIKMEDHDFIPTCLSAKSHQPRDENFLLHYLGCEEYFEREKYLMSLSIDHIKQVEAKLCCIQYLREALTKDLGEGRHSVQALATSLREWRSTEEYQEGIQLVRELRLVHFNLNGYTQKDVKTPDQRHQAEYDPNVEVHAYFMRFKDGKVVQDIQDPRFHEQYPCYRVSIDDLINQDEEITPLVPPEDTINYIHLPGNNMSVSTNIQN